MTPDKARKVAEKLYRKLLSDKIPDDATGPLHFNLQTGGMSGKVYYEVDLEDAK